MIQASAGNRSQMLPISVVLAFDPVLCDESSGRLTPTLRGRADRLTASRVYAGLFKAM